MACTKSKLNKTIDFELGEGAAYLERCMTPDGPVTEDAIIGRTLLGDSSQVLDFLPDSFVDLLILDPPYNLSKNFHGFPANEMPDSRYREYLDGWLDKLLHTLKPTASVYFCSDWKSSLVVGNLLSGRFMLRNRITWQREKGRGAKANWKNSMEDIWFATVSDDYTFNLNAVKQRKRVIAPYKAEGKPKDWERTGDGNYRNTCPSNFWDDISIPYWSMPENTAHPTQKPEKLLAKLILASSNPGDIVLDPFLGSGTTSVTAKKLGRRFVGIEKHPLYCAWAEKRLELAETHPDIQGYSGGVFWERNTLALQKKSRT